MSSDDGAPYIAPPGLLRRVVNPVVSRLGLAPVLVVAGRRSGKLIEVPLGAPFEFEGARYLVSGRGNTHWVRNLRASGCAEFRRGRRREEFRAIEIEGDERARIVAAYRARLGRSVDRYFAEIPDAADHPVFRMEPLED